MRPRTQFQIQTIVCFRGHLRETGDDAVLSDGRKDAHGWDSDRHEASGADQLEAIKLKSRLFMSDCFQDITARY